MAQLDDDKRGKKNNASEGKGGGGEDGVGAANQKIYQIRCLVAAPLDLNFWTKLFFGGGSLPLVWKRGLTESDWFR